MAWAGGEAQARPDAGPRPVGARRRICRQPHPLHAGELAGHHRRRPDALRRLSGPPPRLALRRPRLLRGAPRRDGHFVVVCAQERHPLPALGRPRHPLRLAWPGHRPAGLLQRRLLLGCSGNGPRALGSALSGRLGGPGHFRAADAYRQPGLPVRGQRRTLGGGVHGEALRVHRAAFALRAPRHRAPLPPFSRGDFFAVADGLRRAAQHGGSLSR